MREKQLWDTSRRRAVFTGNNQSEDGLHPRSFEPQPRQQSCTANSQEIQQVWMLLMSLQDNMDVYQDVNTGKENSGDTHLAKGQQDSAASAALQPRTPLVDLTNKRGKTITGLLGSTKKEASGQHARLEALNLQTKETPKKHKSSASRRSCFPAFHIAEDFMGDVRNKPNSAGTSTLPGTVEEEPETDMFESIALVHKNTLKYQEATDVEICVAPTSNSDSGEQENESRLKLDSEIIPVSQYETVNSSSSHQKSSPVQAETYETDAMIDNGSGAEERQSSLYNLHVSAELEGDTRPVSPQSLQVSVVEDEAEKIVDMLLLQLTNDLVQSSPIGQRGPANQASGSHVSKDHSYVQSSWQMDQRSLVSMMTPLVGSPMVSVEQISASLSSPSHPSVDQSSMYSSTPTPQRSANQDLPSLHSFPSSPYEVTNISNSSFREHLQGANLSELMETYLLPSSSSPMVNSSLSSPSVCWWQKSHLSAIAEFPAMEQGYLPESGNINPQQWAPDMATIPSSPKILSPDSDFAENSHHSRLPVAEKMPYDIPAHKEEIILTSSTNSHQKQASDHLSFSVPSTTAAGMEGRKTDSDQKLETCTSSGVHESVDELKQVTDEPPLLQQAEQEALQRREAVDFINYNSVLFTPNKNRPNTATEISSVDSYSLVPVPLSQPGDQSYVEEIQREEPHSPAVTNTFQHLEVLQGYSQDEIVIIDRDQTTVVAFMSTDTSSYPDSQVPVITDNSPLKMHNISTSPCVEPVSDKSVLTDHHSQVNTSMVTETCQTSDVSMLTDGLTKLDHSMMAIPDLLNKQTMTERTMIDAESAMTPFKQSKTGKRLTAEEVRRQHPRTVANHLESTMAANQRLEKEVKTLTQERDRLKLSQKETRARLSSAETQQKEEKASQEKRVTMLEQLHAEAVSGLESCVEEKQRRIYQLEEELAESRTQCLAAEEKLVTATTDFELRYDQLEKLKQKAELHFADELQTLRTQFDEQNYHTQFLQSQQIIQELQVEREEFLALMDDIEGATAMQFRLRDALHHLAKRTAHIASTQNMAYQHLAAEHEAICQKLATAEVALKVSGCEREDLAMDVHTMEDLLKQSNDSLVQLESKYQNMWQELTSSQAQVLGLTDKLNTATQELADERSREELLTQQLCEQQDSETLMCQTLQEAQDNLDQLQQELDTCKDKLSSNEQIQDKMKADHEQARSRLELHIENLQYTLDSWEVDREVHQQEMAESHQRLEQQRVKMEEMANELTALRKIKVTSQAEKDVMTELKNTNQFLEAEKQLYLEAVTDYRTQLEAELELAASNQELIEALRANNSELQQSYEHLAYEVQMLEETVSMKTMDIETSWTALENMEEKMEALLSSLQEKFGIEVKTSSAKTNLESKFASPLKIPSSSCQGHSLVAQVLARASQLTTPDSKSQGAVTSLSKSISVADRDRWTHAMDGDQAKSTRIRQSNVDPKATALISPASQTFCVSSNRQQLTAESKRSASFSLPGERHVNSSDVSRHGSGLLSPSGLNQSVAGFAKIRSIQSTLDRTIDSLSDRSHHTDQLTSGREASSGNCERISGSPGSASHSFDSGSLAAKVREVSRLFTMIVRAANMAERASQLTIQDLKADMTLLRDKLKFQHRQCRDLETELTQKSSQLTTANSQIKELNTRVTGMTKSLLKFQDQQLEISRLEDEKADLIRRVRELSGESKLLSDQLEQVIQKLDSTSGGHKGEGACLREIVALKKQNHELMMKLFEERDKSKGLGQKAIRRIKVLEENWSKAEQEVTKFDELVEKIRQTCVTSQAQSTHPAILRVVRLIDGQEDGARSGARQSGTSALGSPSPPLTHNRHSQERGEPLS